MVCQRCNESVYSERLKFVYILREWRKKIEIEVCRRIAVTQIRGRSLIHVSFKPYKKDDEGSSSVIQTPPIIKLRSKLNLILFH